MCLTCGARARSVVTREADRTQHGRTSGRKTSRRRGGSGKSTGDVVRHCRRVDDHSGSSRELVQYHESSRECTLERGNTAAARAEDAQEVGRPGAIW